MTALSLTKETEAARLVLTKRQVPQIKAQMNLVMDVSGSMRHLYSNGQVANVIQRLLALATVVDPDGSIETVAFSDRSRKAATLQAGAFDRAQETFLESSDAVLWGGTDYASGLSALNETSPTSTPRKRGFFAGLFGSKEEAQPQVAASAPTVVFFITDGSNTHGSDSKFKAILEAEKKTYFMLVGVGGRSNFGLLRDAAEEFDNVGLLEANSFADLDSDFYEQVMTEELVAWYQKNAA